MPYRKVELVAGKAYHVYNRGVNRGPIFFREENWAFFLGRMRKYLVPEQVAILAYNAESLSFPGTTKGR